MANSGKPFQYTLDPVIKKNNWDINTLKIEAAQAKEVVDKYMAESEELRMKIEKLEQDIRASHEPNSLIICDKYEGTKNFLNHQHQLLEVKRKELEQAEYVYEQIVSQLRSLKQSTKGLENHRRGKKKIYQMQQERAAIIEADDAWLMRRRHSKT